MKKMEFIMPALPQESFEILKESLKKQLKQAKDQGKLIDVRGVRSLGKTTALIEFARENDYIALVSESVFEKHKENCITKNRLKYKTCIDLDFVIDEGIDITTEEFAGRRINVVTGYCTDLNKDLHSVDNLSETTNDNITLVLKEDLRSLMNKRSECVRNINKRNDASKTALECTRLIKDSLELIGKYDWKLMHSEYRVGRDTNDRQSFTQKQVAVWEQNGEGSIRNHKVWDVVDENMKLGMFMKINPDSIVIGNEITCEELINKLSESWASLHDVTKNKIANVVAGDLTKITQTVLSRDGLHRE